MIIGNPERVQRKYNKTMFNHSVVVVGFRSLSPGFASYTGGYSCSTTPWLWFHFVHFPTFLHNVRRLITPDGMMQKPDPEMIER